MLLIIRGVTLPGAGDGIYYYMYPDLDGLANIVVETQLNLVVPSTQGVRPFTPHKVVWISEDAQDSGISWWSQRGKPSECNYSSAALLSKCDNVGIKKIHQHHSRYSMQTLLQLTCHSFLSVKLQLNLCVLLFTVWIEAGAPVFLFLQLVCWNSDGPGQLQSHQQQLLRVQLKGHPRT